MGRLAHRSKDGKGDGRDTPWAQTVMTEERVKTGKKKAPRYEWCKGCPYEETCESVFKDPVFTGFMYCRESDIYPAPYGAIPVGAMLFTRDIKKWFVYDGENWIESLHKV